MSVVDSIVEVKGEVEVGGTADFEVTELQNLIDVVVSLMSTASHSSFELDEDDLDGEDADAGDVDGDHVKVLD